MEMSDPTLIPPERSFAVLVAIDAYSRAGKGIGRDLRAAVRDAKAVAEVLVDVCGFSPNNLFTLYDEQATKANLEQVFGDVARALERRRGPARLWCHLAGHGLAAADEETQATLFAAWETSADQPSRSGLPAETIRRWLPGDIEEIVVVLDCCHAKGMKSLELPSDPTKRQRRAVIQTSLNGKFAYELKDGSNSLFVKALLEALQGKAELDHGALHFDAVMKYVQERLPELVNQEYGDAVPPQEPQITGTIGDWLLAVPASPWPRLPKLLPGFDTVDPPPSDRAAPWRCLVVLSDVDKEPPQSLSSIVNDALRLAEQRAKNYNTALDSTPLVVSATEALASDARLLELVRALCSVPIAVFDVTNFEPGVMLLLGIRSIVRRGITICSVGKDYTLGGSLAFPFNFREVSFAAHSAAQQHPAARPLMVNRLLAGIREICEHPQYYQDLPGFEAARRPVVPFERQARNARPSIFVLCPFGPTYADQCWDYVESSLKVAFSATLDDDFDVVRMLETSSPRLLTQTLYEQIRRAPYCIVDLTGFRANVLLELGVRLAVSPDGADCLLDGGAPLPAESGYLETQIENLKARLNPLEYRVNGAIEPFSKFAERRSAAERVKPPPTPWFDAITRWIEPGVEIPTLRPDEELRAAARLFAPEEKTRLGSSNVLFPSISLQKQAARAAFDRRLCAWLYLEGRYGVEHVAGDPELALQYRLLATLVLQDATEKDGIRRTEDLNGVLARVREGLDALKRLCPD